MAFSFRATTRQLSAMADLNSRLGMHRSMSVMACFRQLAQRMVASLTKCDETLPRGNKQEVVVRSF
jgi:hypothetical protein